MIRQAAQGGVLHNDDTACAFYVWPANLDLAEARKGIAHDWTQFLDIAKGWCAAHRCRGEP